MIRVSSHTPVFNRRKIVRTIGLRETTPGGVRIVPPFSCGFMGGTASTQGSDSLHGGTAASVGTDVINANVDCP